VQWWSMTKKMLFYEMISTSFKERVFLPWELKEP